MNFPITPELAYIRPGAGFAFIGSFLSLLFGIVLGLVSALLWPFRMAARALAGVVGSVASRGVVSAVCHGPAGLIGVAGPDGKPLVAGRTVTAFSDAEEDAAGTRSASPFSLQEELAALGAIVEVAAPFTVNVRRDGNLITGQNPMSSAAVAQAVTAAVRDLRR